MSDVKLYRGDCRERMAGLPDASFDAVITDPPYDRKSLPLYAAIARLSVRLLRPGGSLLMILPHYALPEVIADVSTHLAWQWMLCMQHGGGNRSSPNFVRRVRAIWKPIGWWTKGKPALNGWQYDGFRSEGKDKALHPWQQSLQWAEYCLRFVPPGGRVLDPCLGAGTLAVACVQQGISCVGIEEDGEYLEVARRRIRSAKRLQPGVVVG